MFKCGDLFTNEHSQQPGSPTIPYKRMVTVYMGMQVLVRNWWRRWSFVEFKEFNFM